MFEINSADILYLLIGIDIPWITGLLFSGERYPKKTNYLQAILMFLIHPGMLMIIKSITGGTFEEIFNPTIKNKPFPLLGMAAGIGLICAFIAFIIIWLKSKDSVSSTNVDKQYYDFTENVAPNQNITLFAGDLSFLGVPKKCDNCVKFECKRISKKPADVWFRLRNKSCPDCCYNKRQYRQFIRLKKDKKISLHILCRPPLDDEDDENYRILLGNLISAFNNKISIKYYDKETIENVYILARIKKDSTKAETMFWHWRICSNNYKKPLEWKTSDTGDIAGYTVHYLLSLFWDKFHAIENNERDKLKREYDGVKTI